MEENKSLNEGLKISEKNLEKKSNKHTDQELVALFNDGLLSKEVVVGEARGRGEHVLDFGFWIINKLEFEDEYLEYAGGIGQSGSNNETEEIGIIFSFLEKKQHKNKSISQKEEGESSLVLEKSKEIYNDEKGDILEPGIQQLLENEERETNEKIEALRREYEEKSQIQLVEKEMSFGKKNWWEVERETEVMMIEDLDGDIDVFKEHMQSLGISEKESNGPYWKWTGKDKKVIFAGDILGDREMDGTHITLLIGDLADQAARENGKIDVLCGNHDMDFISFMCGAWGDKLKKKTASILTEQDRGIWELAKYDSELEEIDPFSAEFKKREGYFWNQLYEKMPQILETMKKDAVGQAILEDICSMKIVTIQDDTLFCHTDLTLEMFSKLTVKDDIAKRVSEINKIFQDGLRAAIFNSVKFGEDFKEIVNTFLKVNNRTYFVKEDVVNANRNIEKLRDLGINAVMHGHSRSAESFGEKGLIIVTPHNNKDGVAIIRTNGEIDFATRTLRDNHS